MKLEEISIEITNKCHQRCIHCSSKSGNQFQNELTLAEIKNIITQSQNLGAHILTISGGEPMLHPDLTNIISFARQKKFEIRLQTCGCYQHNNTLASISDKFINFFCPKNGSSQDKLVFSIMGLPTTHDKHTCLDNSFTTTTTSIHKSVSANIITHVHTVPTNLNFDELEDIYTHLCHAQVDQWHLLRLVNQGRSNQNLELSKKQFIDLQKTIIQLKQKNMYTKIYMGHNIDRRYLIDPNYSIRACGLGHKKALIRPNGNFTFCASLKYENFGNIRNQPLEYLWQYHPSIVSIRRFLRSDYNKINGKCRSCQYLDQCKGGCITQRISKYNNILQGPDPLCFSTPKKFSLPYTNLPSISYATSCP